MSVIAFGILLWSKSVGVGVGIRVGVGAKRGGFSTHSVVIGTLAPVFRHFSLLDFEYFWLKVRRNNNECIIFYGLGFGVCAWGWVLRVVWYSIEGYLLCDVWWVELGEYGVFTT